MEERQQAAGEEDGGSSMWLRKKQCREWQRQRKLLKNRFHAKLRRREQQSVQQRSLRSKSRGIITRELSTHAVEISQRREKSRRKQRHRQRRKNYLVSWGVTCAMILMLLIFMFGVVVYRIAVRASLSSTSDMGAGAPIVASLTASTLNLLAVLLLNAAYKRLARKLTELEDHRTEDRYRRALQFKVTVFEFTNTNASLFYLAFIKGNFIGTPDSEYGYHLDEPCPPYGCKLELSIQLVVLMLGKLLIQNAFEVYLPKVSDWLTQKGGWLSCLLLQDDRFDVGVAELGRQRHRAAGLQPLPWEDDHRLLPYDEMSWVEEYLELTVQFGFCTLFVTAFPLVPLLALVNNLYEKKIDASKLLRTHRRSQCAAAKQSDSFVNFLNHISWLGTITTAMVMSFTSNIVPKLVWQDNYVSAPDTEPGYIASLSGASRSGYIEKSFPVSPVSLEECGAGVGSASGSGWGAPGNWTEVSGWYCSPCRYFSFRDNTGEFGMYFYHVLALRCAYVIIFEHIVFACKLLLTLLVSLDNDNLAKLQMVEDHIEDQVGLRWHRKHGAFGGTLTGKGGVESCSTSVSEDDAEAQRESPPGADEVRGSGGHATEETEAGHPAAAAATATASPAAAAAADADADADARGPAIGQRPAPPLGSPRGSELVPAGTPRRARSAAPPRITPVPRQVPGRRGAAKSEASRKPVPRMVQSSLV